LERLQSALRRILPGIARLRVNEMPKLLRCRYRSLLIAWLLVTLAAPMSGCGHGVGPGAKAPTTAEQIGKRPGWNVVLAEPCSDTFAVASKEVMPAVEQTFKAENWRIQHKDAGTGDIVTEWKPIKHALVSLFAGNIEARCAVSVRPLEASRTLVVFQGGISSKKGLAHNPVMGFAKNASKKASRKWQEKLRAELLREHALHDSTS
jgi:hypothetical protein